MPYNVPGIVLSTLCILTYILLVRILCGKYCIIVLNFFLSVLTLQMGNLRHTEVKKLLKVTQLSGG